MIPTNDTILKKRIKRDGPDRLHSWWELSYAEYLTIPRSVMQSMPDRWQNRMAALLEELDRYNWRPDRGCYKVELRDFGYALNDEGREELVWKGEIRDPLAFYERGRRRVSLSKSTN